MTTGTLPFGSNKERQTAAKGGTKRNRKSRDFSDENARASNVRHSQATRG
jgi:hypothetical protein